jgi:hypothetical protein
MHPKIGVPILLKEPTRGAVVISLRLGILPKNQRVPGRLTRVNVSPPQHAYFTVS